MFYSDKVLEHFLNPRNVGEIPDADGIGTIGDPSCGDCLRVYIKVRDRRLADIKFKLYGCPAAIGTSSITTELAMGKTLEEACAITEEDVVRSLGGLPEQKIHCSVLGPAALRLAILDYVRKLRQERSGGGRDAGAAEPGPGPGPAPAQGPADCGRGGGAAGDEPCQGQRHPSPEEVA